MNRILLLLTAAAGFAGCSTDLEINAPYKENTVVYGLLNMRDTIHYVKINKAFLGEGNAFTFAQIPDSNEYSNEDITKAMVYRNTNGQRVDSFPLRDTLVAGREPGTFYSPVQRMYYFRENNVYSLPQSTVPVNLEQNSVYELDLEVRGTRISGVAPIVNDFSIFSTVQSELTEVNLVSTTQGYGSYEVRWTSNRDGKRYAVQYRFNYTEVRGTDSLEKSITQFVGSRVSSNSQSPEPMSVIIDGELFYSTLAATIPNDPTVTKRIFTGLDFLISVANDEFHTFLTLSEPVTGIVEDRPAYSNVENGFGVFASRYNKDVLRKRLNGASLNELINGQYTGTRRFCSSFNFGPPYGCN
ncbi:MAG: hypothetical protein WEC15_04650 [Flavobacteriales bacterium]